MYDLMIVEDHKWTREGLAQLTPWGNIDVRVKHVCSNGKEAVEELKNSPVDIIISDIRMDEMDGLEFTRFVRKKYPDTKVILISAYQDFEYACEAVNIGACAYILKPVNEKKILQKVKEAIDRIIVEKANVSKIVRHDMNAISNILKECTAGHRKKTGGLRRELQEAGLYLPDGRYIFFVVGVMKKSGKEKELHERIFDTGNRILSFTHDNIVAGIYPLDDDISQYGFRKFLLNLRDEYSDYEPRICTGSVANSTDELANSYEDALKAYNFSYLYSSRDIVYYEQIADRAAFKGDAVFFDFHEIVKSMDECRTDKAFEEIDRVMEMYKSSNIDVYIIESQCINLLNRISKHLLTYAAITERFYKKTGDPTVIKDMNCLDEVREYIKYCIAEAVRIVEQNRNKRIRPVVRKAIEYAEKNIDKQDLTIEKISTDTNISYVYLSKAFKEDLGMNFSEYLNRYRIDMAKKYLKKTDMKIYELCSLIGLEPKYFHYLFKKYESITPKKYQTGPVLRD